MNGAIGIMPQERRKETDCKLPQPEITSFGRWPLAEKNIRNWARDHGLSSDAIEQFLDEIKKAEVDESTPREAASPT